MKIMVTGHRPERLEGMGLDSSDVFNWCRKILQQYTDIEECITGCANGVDTYFADAVMDLGLPLICAFPYRHKLSKPEQKMASYAKEVHWQTEEWYENCYLDRDEWMVKRADVVLAVYDGKVGGGTYYTVKKAKELGKQVIILSGRDGL